MRFIRGVAAAATAVLGSTFLGVATGNAGPASASSATPGAEDVIVHLFQWPWESVARECTQVLGPKGFGAVQVSPPQEHVVLPGKGYPWWQDYQPVSYDLTSRRGDRAAFVDMVKTCHDAGVKIYVDAVVQHMAGGESTGPGSGGSTYSQYRYPTVPYGEGDFHHCDKDGNGTTGDDIKGFRENHRWVIQNCELVDLSDLATESPYVRGKVTAYLTDLLTLEPGVGVDGFRIDAAKHLPAEDLAAMLEPLPGDPYVYSEVIEGGEGHPSPTEYAHLGDVTEFRYGDKVTAAFRSGNLAALQGLAGEMRLDSGDAVAFVDNHDTQRNDRGVLTYKEGRSYELAEAFLIAHGYGTPQVMSSYTFSDKEQGPPTAADGTTKPVTCGEGWECEHRRRTTANMVGLRLAAAGEEVTDWWSNGSHEIAFGRGDAAYVAFNRGGAPMTRRFDTSLPAGTYCDVMSGDAGTDGSCSGTSYVVNEAGEVTATVPPNGAMALHVGARTGGATCTSADVSFAADVRTTWGENVFVVGNTPALGDWNPANAVALSSASYPVWRGSARLPVGVAVQYKYLKKEGSRVVWESDPNRARVAPVTGECSPTWSDTWR